MPNLNMSTEIKVTTPSTPTPPPQPPVAVVQPTAVIEKAPQIPQQAAQGIQNIEQLRKDALALLEATKPAEKPSAPGKMKSATIRLKVDKNGSEVSLENVTPAEMLLLVAEHHQNAGGDPVIEITDVKEVERTNETEVARMAMKYARNKIVKLFPGSSPNLPADFDTARRSGVQQVGASSNLLTHTL